LGVDSGVLAHVDRAAVDRDRVCEVEPDRVEQHVGFEGCPRRLISATSAPGGTSKAR